MQIEHPKIGKCELLLEAEMYFPQGNKYFALVSSKRKPTYDYKTKTHGFEYKPIFGKKDKIQHYVLWGNSPEFELMGITQLLTPGYNPVRGSKPVKWFFDCIKSAKFVNFIHKAK